MKKKKVEKTREKLALKLFKKTFNNCSKVEMLIVDAEICERGMGPQVKGGLRSPNKKNFCEGILK
jgi:hypothetical protein